MQVLDGLLVQWVGPWLVVTTEVLVQVRVLPGAEAGGVPSSGFRRDERWGLWENEPSATGILLKCEDVTKV